MERALSQAPELGAAVDLVPAAPGVPDLVFTANAAVVLDRKVLLARFRHPERQAEEPHFERAFQALKARGLVDSVRKLPDGVVLEGAGDCVFDQTRNMFWLGYGQRSDAVGAARGRGRVRHRGRRRSNSPTRASITWTRRSPRCRAAR